MTYNIIITIILSFILVFLIRAEYFRFNKQVYIFKPLSTLLIISIALSAFLPEGGENKLYMSLILAGLVFSLGGDISLMFESERAFITGLVFFLLAHIIYSAAFIAVSGFKTEDIYSGFIILLMALGAYKYFYPALGNLKIPVLFYVIIISIMLNRAVSTLFDDNFNFSQALLITAGAGLFYLSDFILAVNKFKAPLKYKFNLAVYFYGQLLIAASTIF